MTTLSALFVLLIALIVCAVLLALSAVVRREGSRTRLALGILLAALAAAVWIFGIRNPPTLP